MSEEDKPGFLCHFDALELVSWMARITVYS